MFQDVEHFLGFSDCQSMKSSLLGVAETGTDTSFMINYFVSSFIKRDVPVILISFSQSFSHFNGIGNKLGISLTKSRDAKSFLFVEGLKKLSEITSLHTLNRDTQWKHCVSKEGNVDLVALFKNLKAQFDDFQVATENSAVIIFDNISVLSDIGSSPKEIVSLLQLLKTYAANVTQRPIIVGFQTEYDSNYEETSTLVNYINHASSLNIEIKGLKTGSSKDIHGQVILITTSKCVKCNLKSLISRV